MEGNDKGTSCEWSWSILLIVGTTLVRLHDIATSLTTNHSKAHVVPTGGSNSGTCEFLHFQSSPLFQFGTFKGSSLEFHYSMLELLRALHPHIRQLQKEYQMICWTPNGNEAQMFLSNMSTKSTNKWDLFHTSEWKKTHLSDHGNMIFAQFSSSKATAHEFLHNVSVDDSTTVCTISVFYHHWPQFTLLSARVLWVLSLYDILLVSTIFITSNLFHIHIWQSLWFPIVVGLKYSINILELLCAIKQ